LALLVAPENGMAMLEISPEEHRARFARAIGVLTAIHHRRTEGDDTLAVPAAMLLREEAHLDRLVVTVASLGSLLLQRLEESTGDSIDVHLAALGAAVRDTFG
jgi:hypothetical protein